MTLRFDDKTLCDWLYEISLCRYGCIEEFYPVVLKMMTEYKVAKMAHLCLQSLPTDIIADNLSAIQECLTYQECIYDLCLRIEDSKDESPKSLASIMIIPKSKQELVYVIGKTCELVYGLSFNMHVHKDEMSERYVMYKIPECDYCWYNTKSCKSSVNCRYLLPCLELYAIDYDPEGFTGFISPELVQDSLLQYFELLKMIPQMSEEQNRRFNQFAEAVSSSLSNQPYNSVLENDSYVIKSSLITQFLPQADMIQYFKNLKNENNISKSGLHDE